MTNEIWWRFQMITNCERTVNWHPEDLGYKQMRASRNTAPHARGTDTGGFSKREGAYAR